MTTKSVIRGVLALVVAYGLFLLGLLFAVIAYGYQDQSRTADVIIVLGAGVEPDGSPSRTLTVRAREAAALFEAGIAPYLMCTGGFTGGNPRTEADACREVLLGEGVSSSAILMEVRSINTEQNAIYGLQVMRHRDLQTAVVVSTRYHLLRARWLFGRLGQRVYTSPSTMQHLTPFEITYSYAREIAAFHWQKVRDVFDVPHIYVPTA